MSGLKELQYEDQRMVRDYRHEAYRKWAPVCQAARGLVAERDALKKALDNSQSLLVAILIEKRPDEELIDQIDENRAALSPASHQREEGK